MKALTIVSGIAGCAVMAAFAAPLDTNISNEFWCTYAYTNAVPSVTNSAALAVFSPSDCCAANTAAAAEIFPRGYTTRGEDDVLQRFNSNPANGGTFLIIR